jgi:uncharacterized membrane protein YqjE
MERAAASSTGILGSLRMLGDGFLECAQDRIELFTVELQEEKYRLIQTFIWICAAVFSGMMAIAFGSLTLVYIFWESARLSVLAGLAVFYTAALVATVIAFRRFVSRQPEPFSATRQEIGEDRACIRSES